MRRNENIREKAEHFQYLSEDYGRKAGEAKKYKDDSRAYFQGMEKAYEDAAKQLMGMVED